MPVIKYTLFAGISTLINLLFQFLSFQFYKGFGAFYAALIIGTLSGLLTKYILDKKWIFYHTPKNKQDDAKKFILYSFMGVFTTLVFWGTEMTFYYLIPNPGAKYMGAFLGLAAGYVIKYFLDKKYVFKP